LKKNKKNIPWTLLDIILVIFLELFIFYLTIPLVQFLKPENDLLYSFFIFGIYIFQSFISLGLIFLFTLLKYKTKITVFGFKKINIVSSLKYVFQIWLITVAILIGVSSYLSIFFGNNIPGFAEQIEHIPLFGNTTFGYLSLVVSAFVLAPLVEEIVFRGFILQGLLKKFTPLISILISSLLFAFLHFEFSSIIPLFIIGNILGWIYYKRNNLWDCLLFHAMNNGLALIVEFVLHIYQ